MIVFCLSLGRLFAIQGAADRRRLLHCLGSFQLASAHDSIKAQTALAASEAELEHKKTFIVAVAVRQLQGVKNTTFQVYMFVVMDLVLTHEVTPNKFGPARAGALGLVAAIL